MKKILCSILFEFIVSNGFSTSYFLSENGNDSNIGNSQSSPWQTIAKLNTVGLQPGDSVFFESGSIFRGQINIMSGGTEAAPIYFGKYGTGNLPIISGAGIVSGWTNYLANIYSAPLSQTPAHLFANDKQMTIARFPNSGFLIHQDGLGTAGFIDTNLNEPNGFWNGANVRMRTSQRQWQSCRVDSFKNDSIILQTNTYNSLSDGYGYYFDNLFSLLDTSNEWYYDELSQLIYLIAPGNVDPSILNVEVSVYDYGFLLQNGSSNLTIENLIVEKQRKAGVYHETSSNNLIISSSTFRQQGECGILIPTGCDHYAITHNSFSDINGLGLSLTLTHDGTIANNILERIGLIAGYGSASGNNMTALECNASDSLQLSENTIDSVGSMGIFCGMVNSIIKENILHHCLLNVNDLGSIYVFGANSQSADFSNNIILNSVGNILSAPNNVFNAVGIYVDESATEDSFTSNTIAYATNGILIAKGSSDNFLYHNLVYGCTESQLKISEGGTQGSTSNNSVLRNIFYSLNESADIVKLSSSYSLFNPALFDSNYYFNPYSYHVFKTELGANRFDYPTYYTLFQWQNWSGSDQNSHSTFFNRNRFSVSDSISINLISNSFFTNNFDGWITGVSDTFNVLLDNSTPLDFGCMKLVFVYALPDTVHGVYTSGFKMDSGQLYQFHLSNYSVNNGNVVLKSKENLNGAYLASPQAFPFDNSRHDYNGFITPTNSCLSCLFSLEISGRDSVVWLDNITLYNVTGTLQVPEKKSRLFINPSDGNVTFDLGDSIFFNLDQVLISGSLTLEAYSSAVMIFDSSMILSVHEQVMPQLLKIFPDPVLRGSTITLLIPQVSGDSEISICDLEGKRLLNKMVFAPEKNSQIKIPSTISPGTYFISVRNKYGAWSGKIVVM